MKPNILFFCPTFNTGGVEKVFVNLSNYFDQAGYQITFLTCNDTGLLKDQLNLKIKKHSFNRRLSKSFFSAFKYFKNNNFDVVISAPNYVNILTILINKILLRKKTKIILTHHSFYDLDVKGVPFLHYFYKTLLKNSYNYSDLVIAVSESVKQHLVDEVKIKKKVVVIYNPVINKTIQALKNEKIQHRWFDKNTRKSKIILCVGRLSKVKNQKGLIEIANRMQNMFDFKLIFIGDGEERITLQNLVYKYKLEHLIDFIGDCINPYKFIINSDLVIIPSHSETFSLVAVEAISLGVPIISTPTKGVKEIMQFCNDCYFESINSENNFINRIISVLRYYERQKVDISYVNRFSLNDIGQKYEFEMNRILNEN
jgi:glycosyltransferase involved in cell wall biosynthesis